MHITFLRVRETHLGTTTISMFRDVACVPPESHLSSGCFTKFDDFQQFSAFSAFSAVFIRFSKFNMIGSGPKIEHNWGCCGWLLAGIVNQLNMLKNAERFQSPSTISCFMA
jgi:hypothetical protein